MSKVMKGGCQHPDATVEPGYRCGLCPACRRDEIRFMTKVMDLKPGESVEVVRTPTYVGRVTMSRYAR